MALGPEPAADPVHQVVLGLAGELDHLAVLLDGPRQLFHPGVALVGHCVVDEHQAAVVGQVGEQLSHQVPLGLGGLEEVIVLCHQQGPGAHHGQGVHGLRQLLGGEGLSRQQVVVEALHAGGDELGFHLVQVVVPEVGLLPVENVQGPQLSCGQVLFQLAVGLVGLFFRSFRHGRTPYLMEMVTVPIWSVR